MISSVEAKGYTNVILVMNMRRFVSADDHDRFDKIRNTPDFLRTLRKLWPDHIRHDAVFGFDDRQVESDMTTDELCFVSGVFRLNALEKYSTPAYRLIDKRRLENRFPEELRNNLQYRNIFLSVWQHWDISIRPTVNGMLIIHLTRAYDDFRPLTGIASDVVELQTAFDAADAQEKLRDFQRRSSAADMPREQRKVLEEKQESIGYFLRWLNSLHDNSAELKYFPVQWKIAAEVCSTFIEEIGREIAVPGETPIVLRAERATSSTPLHDSYVVYHFDDMIAPESMIKGARRRVQQLEQAASRPAGATPQILPPKQYDANRKIAVTSRDIEIVPDVRQALAALLEGASLKTSITGKTSAFPRHKAEYVDRLLEQNRATWQDELCLITSRAALIFPDRRAYDQYLHISSFPATVSKVTYRRYWDAVERMIEFVVEIKVLAQIMERTSADLLRDFEDKIARIRSDLARGHNISNLTSLSTTIDKISNVSRLLSEGQSLIVPDVWSRAEFAIDKARFLLEEQQTPVLIENTERNVNNLNSLLSHVDELYLAYSSDTYNKRINRVSLALGIFSLSFVIFSVPSFWTDIDAFGSEAARTLFNSMIDPMYQKDIFFSLAVIGSLLAMLIIMSLLGVFLYMLLTHSVRVSKQVVARTGNGKPRARIYDA